MEEDTEGEHVDPGRRRRTRRRRGMSGLTTKTGSAGWWRVFLITTAWLVATVTAAPHPCKPTEWMHELNSLCEPCYPCHTRQPWAHKGHINPECAANNPKPLNKEGLMLHCSVREPEALHRVPSYTTTTTSEPVPEQGPSLPPPEPAGLSKVSLILLGLLATSTVIIVIVVLYFILRKKQCKTEQVQSVCSLFNANPVSGRSPADHSHHDGHVIIDPPIMVEGVDLITTTNLQSPVEHEDALIDIEQDPSNPVEGDPIYLRCVARSGMTSSIYARWRHVASGRNQFGMNVEIPQCSRFDSGTYQVFIRATDQASNTSITLTKTFYITVQCPSTSTSNGPPVQCRGIEYPDEDSLDERAVEHSHLPSLPLDGSTEGDESVNQPVEGVIVNHPVSSGTSCLLTSGARTPLDAIIMRWEGCGMERCGSSCPMYLVRLLSLPDTLLQLAVLLDCKNTVLRSFAVTMGMTQQEITYVEYCTRGEGNTVKGFITYITGYKGQRDLKVYDFLKFLSEFDNISELKKAIHLLHFIHDCEVCSRLYRSQSPVEDADLSDARYTRQGPQFLYHIDPDLDACRQTLFHFLNEGCEASRNTIKVQLDPQQHVCKAIASSLGGFSDCMFAHMKVHHDAPRGDMNRSISLSILHQIVTIYPQLSVAGFIRCLCDLGQHSTASNILYFHLTDRSPCNYCQTLNLTPIPPHL